MRSAVPCSSLDIYPTIVDILKLKVKNQIEPIDGISLLPLFEGRMTERPRPMGFWNYDKKREEQNPPYLAAEDYVGEFRTFRNFRHPVARTKDFAGEAAWIDNRYKLYVNGGTPRLFDLVADLAEKRDLADEHPQVLEKMQGELREWQASVERSLAGEDYVPKGASE
jgi:arylsulfatase A-like enzyme